MGGVIDGGALDDQATQLVGQAVPAEESTDVDVADLQGADVLEDPQGHGGIEGELLEAVDETSVAVGS